jgi:ribosomal protein S18 acetylase RimI-like enzyme
MEKEISIYKITDYNEIYEALVEISDAYNPPLINSIKDLSKYAKKLTENADVYVAKDMSLLGFIAYYSNDMISKIAYITQLGVLPSAQRRGIGSRLINKSYSVCKEKGMKKIKLEVRMTNDKAIEFYRKEGFVYCGKASDKSIYLEKYI